ncbi:hypothetical protein FRC03_005113 [Tulasnella sp. 419]|nr:hypothetical protein FRC03_005113 [Tulasnella sp. 419]
MPPKKGKGRATKKGKAKETQDVAVEEVPAVAAMEVVEPEPTTVPPEQSANEDPSTSVPELQQTITVDVPTENPSRGSPPSEDANSGMDVDSQPGPPPAASTPTPTMTMEERLAKMEQLRSKMRSSLQANRKDLVEEHTRQKTSARELVRLEKQRKLAETLREKTEAEDRGEDVDRKKNWEYTVEENDEWEKRQARKKRRSNFEFNDYDDAARRKYKKDIEFIKPDLEAYEKQKAAASGSSSTALAAAKDLYRDANSLIYADNKPSEDAIDRVIAKFNKDEDARRKFSRKRPNEDEGDVTYINEANKVFNKKIERYYNKYTAEIRESFERGTAL